MCSIGVYSGWVCMCDCVCVCVCDISPPLLNPDAGHFQILQANNLDTLPSLAPVLSFSSSEWSKPIAFTSIFPTSSWAWEPEFCRFASETALQFWFWRNLKVTWFPTNSSLSFLRSNPRWTFLLPLILGLPTARTCHPALPFRLPLGSVKPHSDSLTSSPATFSLFINFCSLKSDFLQNSVLNLPSPFSPLVISLTW